MRSTVPPLCRRDVWWRAGPWIAAVLVIFSACKREVVAPLARAPVIQTDRSLPTPSKPARNDGQLRSGLLDPSTLVRQAPAKYRAKFTTSKGAFVVQVTRSWAPVGADRFYNLVRAGYYDGVRFHRVIKGAFVQFGIHGDPEVNKAWFDAEIEDDPGGRSNRRGLIAFAAVGEGMRRTEVLINVADNPALDEEGMVPFGEVVSGMKVLDGLRSAHGHPADSIPIKAKILTDGNAYLARAFPYLDHIQTARLVRR